MTRFATGNLNKVLVVENPALVLDELLEDQGMEVVRLTHVPDEEQLIEALNETGAQVLCKRSKVAVTRKVIESCPELLVVQLCCIGDDSVDKKACADHGVMVFNDPVSNGHSVVELVIGNLIALSRRLYETNETCREGDWDKSNAGRFEVLGKRLGVLGLGNIGRGVARAAEALGMEIVFYDTREVSVELGLEMGWTQAQSIESLFAQSDCLTIHLSAADIEGSSNKDILLQDWLSQLGAERENSPRIFINFSRGFLHEPDILIRAIQSGHIRYAAVDVYPDEPRKGDSWENPYRDEPKIIVFPHIGASTQEAQPRIAHRVAQTLGQFSKFGAVRETPFRPRQSFSLSEQPSAGKALLLVLHSTARGTKRSIDEAIYEAGASNLASVHRDFNEFEFAYDLACLDAVLTEDQLGVLTDRAAELTGDLQAIRSIRVVPIGK